MGRRNQFMKFWDVIRAFFPFQLLIDQLKHNVFALFFWAILFLIVNDSLGYAFGIPLLFLSPEYLGDVSGWSFFLLGLAFGGFTMGFNTFSYIRIGPKYPFIATLAKPFYKFCLNNSIIPLVFFTFFSIRVIEFQLYEELATFHEVILYLFCLALGTAIFVTLSFLFFFRVSRNNHKDTDQKPITSLLHRQERWYEQFRKQKERTSIYFGKWLQLNVSRSSEHLNQKLVEKVLGRYKINASVYELLTISIFFILGAFSDYEAFEVPAAVSIVLLLSIFLMLFSALHSWFKGWVYPILLLVLLSMNYLSEKTSLFNYTNQVYGLNYEQTNNDPYSIEAIRNISSNDSNYNASLIAYTQTLENWKLNTNETKPKLIIINTSGGGSRSALWTTIVLQECDKHLNQELTKHTQLITGASGGMIGAAYYRELLLRNKQGALQNPNDPKYRSDISKDMLNKLSFMASTNDIFFRYQSFEFNNKLYTKDRGSAFEEQLHKNTNHLLEHNLGYYTDYEKSGIIPTMVFSPTIINDGRRLLISSQSFEFLTHENNSKHNACENIDFHALLPSQNTLDTRFSSVLRSSATFPFVMPMVTLPTQPEVQLMDAGIRDNYGIKTTVEFLSEMQDWISENTSGVIIVQIRDTKKVLDDQTYRQISFIDKITLPFGNMYKNFPKVQDFNQEELLNFTTSSVDFPIDVVTFNLREKEDERISLSWHLTKQEKKKIEEAFMSRKNQRSLSELNTLLRKQ